MGTNTKGALLALTGFAVFACHDVIARHLGGIYSPFQTLFFSVMFGFPLVSVMLVGDARSDTVRPRHLWWNLLRVAAMLLSSTSVFYAFSVLPLAETYAILFTIPLFVTLLAIPILGEKVGFHRGGAILVGLVGVLIVIRPGASEISPGHFAALAGSFGAGLASVTVRRIGGEERGLVLLLFPMLGSFLVMGSLMPFVYKPMPLVDIGLVAVLSILGFIALNFMIQAYKTGEAAVVAPMQYSQIIWALVFGYTLFDEVPDSQTLAGVAVIVASGIYIVVRESMANVSGNRPVLRTRSRVAGGTWFQIGPVLRRKRRMKKRNRS